MQSDAKSAENTGKTKEASEKTPVQTPDETAAGASATASENPQLTRYLAQEYGKDWAQTVTPEQLQKAKYRLGLAVTDDPALNTPLYNNLTPDAVQELKREYGRRRWDKATEEDVLIVQQASLAGKDSAADGITQGNDADLEESVKKGSEPLTGNTINRDTSVTGSRKPYITSRPNYGKNQVQQVWTNAIDPITGKVYDPSGVEITWDSTKGRNGQWDMGHIPKEKYSKMHQLYMENIISREEFLKWYRNPNNYRPELPSTNRSHRYEK